MCNIYNYLWYSNFIKTKIIKTLRKHSLSILQYNGITNISERIIYCIIYFSQHLSHPCFSDGILEDFTLGLQGWRAELQPCSLLERRRLQLGHTWRTQSRGISSPLLHESHRGRKSYSCHGLKGSLGQKRGSMHRKPEWQLWWWWWEQKKYTVQSRSQRCPQRRSWSGLGHHRKSAPICFNPRKRKLKVKPVWTAALMQPQA